MNSFKVVFTSLTATLSVSLAPHAWAHCQSEGACVTTSFDVIGDTLSSTSLSPSGQSELTAQPLATGGASALALQEGAAVSANSGSFDIVIDPGAGLNANPAALAAFNRAAEQWEAFITDPVTVTIAGNFTPSSTGALGSSRSPILTSSYTTVRNALVEDAANESDDAIVGFLPTANQFLGFAPDGISFTSGLGATAANLRAVGLGATVDRILDGAPDSTIELNSNVNFDFDNSDGVDAGSFDFESIALHEIGHALGFVSAVDTVDFLVETGAMRSVTVNAVDLFRFNAGTEHDPSTPEEFATAARWILPGGDAIFDQVIDLDFGDVEILLSTGTTSGGDGRQASHFADNLGLGVLDPTLGFREVVTLSANDLRALDLIGFDIVIPEPCAALLLGCGGMGLLAGRRRRGA